MKIKAGITLLVMFLVTSTAFAAKDIQDTKALKGTYTVTGRAMDTVRFDKGAGTSEIYAKDGKFTLQLSLGTPETVRVISTDEADLFRSCEYTVVMKEVNGEYETEITPQGNQSPDYMVCGGSSLSGAGADFTPNLEISIGSKSKR